MDEDKLAQLIATQLAIQSQTITETIRESERRQAQRLDQVQDYAQSLEQKINLMSSGGAGTGTGIMEPTRRSTRRTMGIKKTTQTRESIVMEDLGEDLHGIYDIDIKKIPKPR